MDKKISVSQQRLRGLAPRALQVVEQYKPLHVGIAMAATTLAPAAEAYIKVYDNAVRFRGTQGSDMEQGRQSLEELAKAIRSSLALAHRVIPSFAADDLNATQREPERLISDGRKVLELLNQAGKSVSSGEAMMGWLSTAVEKAESEWAQAQVARRALQESQALVREHAVALNDELVALRKVLRDSVGTSHLAYQALRSSRVVGGVSVDEEATVVDETAETLPGLAPSTVVVPSSTVTNGIAGNGAATNGINHNTAIATGVSV